MGMSMSTHYGKEIAAYGVTSRTPRFGRLIAAIRKTWDAIGDGFAASGHYHELTSTGMTHDRAASKVFREHFANR